MKTDMTQGKPVKVLLGFTIPVFIGNVFQQFYNMVDAVVVGKFVGTKALAAVGSTGTIIFLIIGFLLGLTAGFTVLTAQKYGAGKMDEMRQTVGNALILTALISAVMTAVSMTGMHALLKFMHTPDDIFKDAYAYIMVICGGIAAQMLYNFLSSVLRALGNSKVPDSCGAAQHCAGYGIYHCISHGRSRCGMGDRDFTGDFGNPVSGIYCEGGSDPAFT